MSLREAQFRQRRDELLPMYSAKKLDNPVALFDYVIVGSEAIPHYL